VGLTMISFVTHMYQFVVAQGLHNVMLPVTIYMSLSIEYMLIAANQF